MKKLFTLLICISSLLLGFTSCGDEAFDVDSVNRQTLLVFMPWSGSSNTASLYENLRANVDSMCAGIKAQKGLKNARVLVFMSRNSQESNLFELKYDDSKKVVVRDTLKKYTDGAFYNSAEGMASLINEVKQQAEALNYAMIIGCHGCGWTYAADWMNYPYHARPNLGGTSSNYDYWGSIQFGDDLIIPRVVSSEV